MRKDSRGCELFLQFELRFGATCRVHVLGPGPAAACPSATTTAGPRRRVYHPSLPVLRLDPAAYGKTRGYEI